MENNKKSVLHYVKLTNPHHFKQDFQKVDQHAEGKLLIHSIKHLKDNQLQSLELPCGIS